MACADGVTQYPSSIIGVSVAAVCGPSGKPPSLPYDRFTFRITPRAGLPVIEKDRGSATYYSGR